MHKLVGREFIVFVLPYVLITKLAQQSSFLSNVAIALILVRQPATIQTSVQPIACDAVSPSPLAALPKTMFHATCWTTQPSVIYAHADYLSHVKIRRACHDTSR